MSIVESIRRELSRREFLKSSGLALGGLAIAAIVAALQLPEVRERLASQGVDPQHNTPEEFAKLLASDVVRWAKVIQRAGVKQE